MIQYILFKSSLKRVSPKTFLWQVTDTLGSSGLLLGTSRFFQGDSDYFVHKEMDLLGQLRHALR